MDQQLENVASASMMPSTSTSKETNPAHSSKEAVILNAEDEEFYEAREEEHHSSSEDDNASFYDLAPSDFLAQMVTTQTRQAFDEQVNSDEFLNFIQQRRS